MLQKLDAVSYTHLRNSRLLSGDSKKSFDYSSMKGQQVELRTICLLYTSIKVSDNGDDTEAGWLAGPEFTAYLKSALSVKADGSYDFDKATPVVIGENGATTITSDDKAYAVSIAIPYGTYVVVESKTCLLYTSRCV